MMNKKLASFVFLFVCCAATTLFAAEENAANANDVKMWLAISAGFGMALASMGGAISQSIAISSALTGISRNPGASGKIMVPMIIGLALIESLVLFTLVVTNGLKGLIQI
jgi:F-type H+-transporting ATPase subunit c